MSNTAIIASRIPHARQALVRLAKGDPCSVSDLFPDLMTTEKQRWGYGFLRRLHEVGAVVLLGNKGPQRRYQLALDVEKPLGMMRATVDDDDLASTQQVREVGRVRSAVSAVKRTNDLISPSKVRDPALKNWLRVGVAPLLKTLQEDDRIFRLLPPKKDEEK